ncbi:MAG: MATE family efflux transporter [Sediminibacterium sp.]|nr:MATE family efflux transporter [Sediminibacterium sp.]MBP6144079.1 MATE family efflux transporter [Sediminibacterium sp.]
MSQATATPSLQVNISSKQILTISIPIAMAILVPQFNFIINNIFLGALSKQALAIGGITGVYYLIFGVMGQGLNNGLQALISRRAGENRVDEIGILFSQGVMISIFLSVIGISFTYFIAPTLFHALLHDTARANTIIEFLKIRIWGIPFLFIYQMRNALLVGTNQSKFLIIGTATEAAVNIFFDYSLIFGHFGFSAMGLNGAAYASIIAEIMGLLVIYLVIHYQKIGARFDLFKKFELKLEYVKLILVQSSPLMMQYMISIISWEFFYILIEHRGEQSLAVSNAMRNIFGFFGCFTWAFAATTTTMVSNIIGQNLQDKVIELIYKIMRWSFGIAIAVAIIINVFAAEFLSIYGQGAGFLTEGIPVLRIVSIALLLMSVSTIWLSAVTGTGQSKVTLLIEFAAIVIYIIYNYLVLEYYQLPITYGWFSEVIYWLSLLTPSFFYIRTMRWKDKKI